MVKKGSVGPLSVSSVVETGKKISDSCLTLLDAVSKPKLKIALITYYFEKPSHNGTAIHAQNLAKYLSEHNCEVHVFCTGKEDSVYKEGKVIVHTIGKMFSPLSSDMPKTRLEYDLFESEVVKSIIRENIKKKFDIIHTHGELVKAAFILKKVYDVKWIHTFHAIEKLRVEQLSKEEKAFGDLISWIESTTNYCDGAIFVSNDLIKEGKKHYQLKSTRVIPNGVDLSLFSFTPIIKKNVLFVGRFSKDKGIHHMPKLIEEVMSIPNATFTICAPYETPTPELKGIEKVILGLKEKYGGRLSLFLLAQKQDAIREFYKNCQVYIQPSKYESFGLCIVEAMATGRPVVAFHVGGIPEVIGDAGFTVKNIDDFADKIKELLKDVSLCNSIGKKASARAKIFDWGVIALKTIEYYNEVLK